MKFVPSFGPARVIALSLVLLSAGPAMAQKTTIKTKKAKGKAKTEVASAVGTTVAVPQPAPSISEPQVMEVAVPVTASTRTETAGWLSDLGVAQEQAKATNQPIVAVFSGSDWCKPCIMYEQEVFAKPEFMEFAKGKLVLAHFDFPRQKKNQPSAAQLKLNEAAAAQLNREGDFPLAVIIGPDGKVLAKTGYIAGGPAAFEAYLQKVIPGF